MLLLISYQYFTLNFEAMQIFTLSILQIHNAKNRQQNADDSDGYEGNA